MCGIVGFISKDNNKNEIIKKMNDKIAHRGPDGEGYYLDAEIALGHRRLSIIDLNGGKQPMINDRYAIIFNGEIYNYKELKEELKYNGYNFKTDSDPEVLLVGYDKWGKELPKKLRGMFAFAIWDKLNKTLFCARDHFGMKPFYYYQNSEVFMFGSEIKSFLEHPKFVKELNKDILGLFLSFSFTPTDETFFKDVYSLPAGHFVIIKNNIVKIEKYFEVNFEEENKNLEDFTKDINNVMVDSINHHLISDVEIGAFLSSGIDSSYIVSLATPNKTYTIGYNNKNYNEINYAKNLTNKLKLKNINKLLSKEEYMDSVSKVLYYMDEPLYDPSAISLFHLSKLASKDVKVVLGGEGADELFAGYNTYKIIDFHKKYFKIPFIIRKSLSTILNFFPEFKGRNFIVRNGQKLEDYYIGVDKIFNKKEVKKILNFSTNLNNKIITKEIFKNCKNKNDLIKMQTIDINLWLVKDILLKSDKMAMANSLEVRCPFIDTEVYKIARSIPQKYKVENNTTKIALRESASKVIPNNAFKKTKLGFPVPLRDWICEDDFYNEIFNMFKKDYVSDFFNQKYILKLLEQHKNHKKDNYKKIWIIYSFLKWYEVFF